jgi:hypothetical protein
MTTELQTLATEALAKADPNGAGGVKLQAIKHLRDATRDNPTYVGLRELVVAVEWAMEQRTQVANLARYRMPSDFGWQYRFPNGHDVSVITDPRADAPFRFEVLSDDPADAGRGGIAPGLTSDQVEAKLHGIAALPTR